MITLDTIPHSQFRTRGNHFYTADDNGHIAVWPWDLDELRAAGVEVCACGALPAPTKPAPDPSAPA